MIPLLCIALFIAAGGLEDRLMSRVAHGEVISTLSIDRDVVLTRDRVLMARLRIEGTPAPPSDQPEPVFWIQRCPCSEPLPVRAPTLPMPYDERPRTAEFARPVPLRDSRGEPLGAGRHRLYVRWESDPPLFNALPFEVR